jgi:hypothetical protein
VVAGADDVVNFFEHQKNGVVIIHSVFFYVNRIIFQESGVVKIAVFIIDIGIFEVSGRIGTNGPSQ